jgi:hypothetical protein
MPSLLSFSGQRMIRAGDRDAEMAVVCLTSSAMMTSLIDRADVTFRARGDPLAGGSGGALGGAAS